MHHSIIIEHFDIYKFCNIIINILNNYKITPDDSTILFVDMIIYFASIVFIILLFNTISSILKLTILRNKIYNIISNDDFHIHENKLSEFAGISQQTNHFSEILQPYNNILYSTQDVETASHFLWSPSILHSRILPACAAILTGLGVLGTFVGLLLGLQGLELQGGADELQAGIQQVADGASVAFETSVWGVSLSLLLTFLEKLLCTAVARSFLKLQNLLVRLFPPFPIQKIIHDMRTASRETADRLGILAEQIGDNMQRSLDSFSENLMSGLSESISKASSLISSAINDSLTESIRTTLLPSIDNISLASKELAERQAKGSEEVLGKLISQFIERIGESGNTQKMAMQEATQHMQQTMGEFSASMNGLVSSLQEEQQVFAGRQQEQIEKLDTAFHSINEVLSKNMDKARDGILDMISSFSDNVQKELQRQSSDLGMVSDSIHNSLQEMSDIMKDFFTQLKNHQENVNSSQTEQTDMLKEQMQQVFNQQSNTLKSVESTVDKHVLATKNLLEQGNKLQQRLNEESVLLKDITDAMSCAGDSLKEAGSDLQSFSEQINKAINRNAQSTEKAVAVVQSIAEQENIVSREMQKIFAGLSPIQSSIKNVTDSMLASVNVAKNSYDQLSENYAQLQISLQTFTSQTQRQNQKYLEELGMKMQQQVEKLDNQMVNLLTDYANLTNTQINERMNDWNEQTKKFCTTMLNTSLAMAEVVDSMDTPRH